MKKHFLFRILFLSLLSMSFMHPETPYTHMHINQEGDQVTIVRYASDGAGAYVYQEEYVDPYKDARFVQHSSYEKPYWVYQGDHWGNEISAHDIKSIALPRECNTQAYSSYSYSPKVIEFSKPKFNQYNNYGYQPYIAPRSNLNYKFTCNVWMQETVYREPGILELRGQDLWRYIMKEYPTVKDALEEPLLFLNDDFIVLAKEFPMYCEYVEKHYKKYIAYSAGWKLLCHLFGDYRYGTCTRFIKLYEGCRGKREEELREKEYQEEQAVRMRKNVYRAQLNSLFELYKNGTKDDQQKTYYTDRLQALYFALGRKKNSSPSENITIPDSVNLLTQPYDIPKNIFIPLNMDAYQLQIHKEFIDQLFHTSQLTSLVKTVPQYQMFIDTVVHTVSCGMHCNSEKKVVDATRWADYGWKALSIATAVYEGITEGTEKAIIGVANSIIHPVDTICSLVYGAKAVGYLMASAAVHMARFHIAFEQQDEKKLKELSGHTVQLFESIFAECNQAYKEATLGQIVKTSAIIATEALVAPYIYSSLGKLCWKARPILAGIGELPHLERIKDRMSNSKLAHILKNAKDDITKKVKNKAHKMLAGLGPYLPEVADCPKHIAAAIERINSNKIHHILTPGTKKHAWHKIIDGEVTWVKVRSIIEKVMQEGKLSPVKSIFQKELSINNQFVEVAFIFNHDSTLTISNAWVRTI